MSYNDKSWTKRHLYAEITIKELDDNSSFYDPIARDSDYWKLDHETMKYFEEIEEIPKPNDWEDFYRLDEKFQYHSQYIQYNKQCYELAKRKLGEYLDELFHILQGANGESNACKKQRIYNTLSQGLRYKHKSNKNSV